VGEIISFLSTHL